MLASFAELRNGDAGAGSSEDGSSGDEGGDAVLGARQLSAAGEDSELDEQDAAERR